MFSAVFCVHVRDKCARVLPRRDCGTRPGAKLPLKRLHANGNSYGPQWPLRWQQRSPEHAYAARSEPGGRHMRLWRMSAQTRLEDACWQEDAGRWHFAGSAVLYVSQSPELAVLEALVHHRVGMSGYWLSSISVPPRVRMRTIALDDLPADWRRRKRHTRALGDAWLREARYPVLCVPSAVVPVSHNYLVNPAHAAVHGRLRLHPVTPMRFDRRLVDPSLPAAR
jgi:RES domain-containing protein